MHFVAGFSCLTLKCCCLKIIPFSRSLNNLWNLVYISSESYERSGEVGDEVPRGREGGQNDCVLIIKVIELFEFVSLILTEQSRQFDLQATYSVDVIFLDGEREWDFK